MLPYYAYDEWHGCLMTMTWVKSLNSNSVCGGWSKAELPEARSLAQTSCNRICGDILGDIGTNSGESNGKTTNDMDTAVM